MTLLELLPGEPWMNPEERGAHTRLIQSFIEQFARCGLAETPFLALCVAEAASLLAVARRLESSLAPDPDHPCAPAVTPTLANHIGRARERLRKVLKEIEAACALAARTAHPVHTPPDTPRRQAPPRPPVDCPPGGSVSCRSLQAGADGRPEPPDSRLDTIPENPLTEATPAKNDAVRVFAAISRQLSAARNAKCSAAPSGISPVSPSSSAGPPTAAAPDKSGAPAPAPSRGP